MYGFSVRGLLAWMKLASTSLPTPESPVMRTGTSVSLTFSAMTAIFFISGLSAMNALFCSSCS